MKVLVRQVEIFIVVCLVSVLLSACGRSGRDVEACGVLGTVAQDVISAAESDPVRIEGAQLVVGRAILAPANTMTQEASKYTDKVDDDGLKSAIDNIRVSGRLLGDEGRKAISNSDNMYDAWRGFLIDVRDLLEMCK